MRRDRAGSVGRADGCGWNAGYCCWCCGMPLLTVPGVLDCVYSPAQIYTYTYIRTYIMTSESRGRIAGVLHRMPGSDHDDGGDD